MNKSDQPWITLSTLQAKIAETLRAEFSQPGWVVAEISEMNENLSGHCYLDLVETESASKKVIARARATIWAYAYRMLKPFFETSTGYALEPGIRIMVRAQVEYHPVYGLSLNIKDIDPTYTLGDLAKRRQEIISRLKEDGVFGMNRELTLPLVPQRIAIISSATAAGYKDFTDQLTDNPYRYVFHASLFPAVMQGDQAPASIIAALDQIYLEARFEIVAIIRGGGSKSDLACFDDYELNAHIAQFPLPVLTGIGHEQDESIADMVAHTRLKTPTAVAEFIIDRAAAFEVRLDELSDRTAVQVRQLMHDESLRLQLLRQQTGNFAFRVVAGQKEFMLGQGSRLKYTCSNLMTTHHNRIHNLGKEVRSQGRQFLLDRSAGLKQISNRATLRIEARMTAEQNKMDGFEKLCDYADPRHIMKLGFSITRKQGKALKGLQNLQKGEILETELHRGKIKSKITDIPKKSIH